MTNISLHQISPIENSVEANFERLCNLVKQDHHSEAQLSILPEDYFLGITRNANTLREEAALFPDRIKALQQIAKKYSIAIIPGTFPTIEKGRLYNSTLYIDEFGHIKFRYSKHNLWLSERSIYSQGNRNPHVFMSPLGRTSIIICWDIFNPSVFEHLTKQGVQWIVVVAFWSRNQSKELNKTRGDINLPGRNLRDPSLLDSLIQARASEYNIGVIFCNYAGKYRYVNKLNEQDQAISAGRTQAVTAAGVVGKISNSKESTLTVTIPDIALIIEQYETAYGRREDIGQDYASIKAKEFLPRFSKR